jgi:hypothetical protein
VRFKYICPSGQIWPRTAASKCSDGGVQFDGSLFLNSLASCLIIFALQRTAASLMEGQVKNRVLTQ